MSLLEEIMQSVIVAPLPVTSDTHQSHERRAQPKKELKSMRRLLERPYRHREHADELYAEATALYEQIADSVNYRRMFRGRYRLLAHASCDVGRFAEFASLCESIRHGANEKANTLIGEAQRHYYAAARPHVFSNPEGHVDFAFAIHRMHDYALAVVAGAFLRSDPNLTRKHVPPAHESRYKYLTDQFVSGSLDDPGLRDAVYGQEETADALDTALRTISKAHTAKPVFSEGPMINRLRELDSGLASYHGRRTTYF